MEIKCPVCQSEYVYEDRDMYVCSMCGHEFKLEDANKVATFEEEQVIDSLGNVLQHGDSVIVIKDLKVKGASNSIKIGTKVKNIRIRPGEDHNIDCKTEGFGEMKLKSEFVKKA